MRPLETIATLRGFDQRGPGTDAERRAARWLAGELRAEGFRVVVEPFWCRPNWALAHAWHVALALAGSLVSVSHPAVGVALLGAALLSIFADELTGLSLGRRLTPERASQNLVRQQDGDAREDDPASLIVTANYDAGRAALIYRDSLRGPAASLRRLSGPFALGWLGCVSLAIGWVLAIAVIRLAAHASPSLLGAVQLAPTVALVLALALLLEAAGAGYGPASNDNASGTGVAISLVEALRAAPPRNLSVELVLQGAGEGHEIGLRRYLRTRRRKLLHNRTVVLGIAACGDGEPRWWHSDGRLIPLRYTRRLRELARAASHDRAQAHRGRGGTPALPARTRRLPALAIGTLDRRGLPGHTQGLIEPASLDGALEFGLLLVEAIDAALAPDPSTSEKAATPA